MHIILVVEDEVLLRMMLSDQLREAGYRVLEASGADEALEYARFNERDWIGTRNPIRAPL